MAELVNNLTCYCGKTAEIKTLIDGLDVGFCSRECMVAYSKSNPEKHIIILDKETQKLLSKKPELLEKYIRYLS